jgi:septal ring factor EnvC (AmiA/AmiB activator)
MPILIHLSPSLFTNTEVDKLQFTLKELTDSQEKVASNLKIKLDDNERVVSSKEEEISSTRVELALLEQQIALHKASTVEKMTNQLVEIESARQYCQEMVDNAESELKAARVMHTELTREDGDVVSACVYVYYMYLMYHSLSSILCIFTSNL